MVLRMRNLEIYAELQTSIIFRGKLNLLRGVRSLIYLVCKMIYRCCRPLIYPKNTFEEKIICSLFSNLIIDLSTLFLILNYREWRRVDTTKKYGSALEIGWFGGFFHTSISISQISHSYALFDICTIDFLYRANFNSLLRPFVQYYHVVQKCNNIFSSWHPCS